MSNIMSINPEDIDLDGIDLESLGVEDKILVLRLKGEIGTGDYSQDRHKWLDTLSDEEIKSELLRIAEQKKNT